MFKYLPHLLKKRVCRKLSAGGKPETILPPKRHVKNTNHISYVHFGSVHFGASLLLCLFALFFKRKFQKHFLSFFFSFLSFSFLFFSFLFFSFLFFSFLFFKKNVKNKRGHLSVDLKAQAVPRDQAGTQRYHTRRMYVILLDFSNVHCRGAGKPHPPAPVRSCSMRLLIGQGDAMVHVKTLWPSGLRRQTQVLVERSAWVRTPQVSLCAHRPRREARESA